NEGRDASSPSRSNSFGSVTCRKFRRSGGVQQFWSADVYLEDTSALKTAKAIGEEAFFNAVGEVANWLSASDECLRVFEVVKTTRRCDPHQIPNGEQIAIWSSNRSVGRLSASDLR